MIDFLTQQENIQAYIETNYPKVLEEIGLENVGAYINDFLDFDKYTKNTQLFYDFGNYDFSSLSNESNTEEIDLRIYLTFKGASSGDLNKKMMRYTAGFYEMFERSGCNFDGLADFGTIESVSFFQATEGNTNVKLAELRIKLQTER